MNQAVNKSDAIPLADPKIAIIGGGVAGSTIALRFAELGIDTSLIEKGDSLVNGPPFCHLHAGGNLYREISDEQCLTLLQQSIDTVKVYPQSVNKRPTVVALPKSDPGEPLDLLPRLEKLRAKYRSLVEQDVCNAVLGDPEQYFRLYERAEIEALKDRPLPEQAQCLSDWLVAFAQQVDLDSLKFPIVLVQEYGLSAFRFSAIASLAIERLPDCHLYTNTQVVALEQLGTSNWRMSMKVQGENEIIHTDFDYVINACGFKSGEIDDMLSAKRKRMVEFKAAYVAHWPKCKGLWPEVIFYGQRGTPQGMAQLTPYPDGYFQLHGMTQDITLFKNGLVASCENSAQPKLAERFINKIERQWPAEIIEKRTLGSIEHIAQYIPSFNQANVAAKPLFGAQQIPGDDADLRAAGVSFHGERYARTEIVKASSALAAADAILQDLMANELVSSALIEQYATKHYFPITRQCTQEEVTAKAEQLARQRQYPEALAKNF
ncbi:FAD-binding oxidoreductase [Shewanella eurypsychrophilus]|uniref:FAD-binding oxidoreductase n=1 Tax=Shewanella eurypsychrophilus TaxID=2593656 RepID=A0ABX6V1X1_9GAMM|nr:MULTISPECIES: FAD-dependent oxidoreductase [Shewanella]QFU21329.1 FAD-dependent oxidoreductase [Shewanella sp. YLB-09]QPG56619.1 FAD-binding oxidoreductase [Shewanella eurypsychrophilus]